jgi:hypothetical protein
MRIELVSPPAELLVWLTGLPGSRCHRTRAWTRRLRRLRGVLGRRRAENSEKPPLIGGGRDEGGALGPLSAQPMSIAAGSAKTAA